MTSDFPPRFSRYRLKQYMMTLILTFICSIAFWVQEQHLQTRMPDSDVPIELYSNQTNHDLKTTFAEAIDRAEDSVLLLIYSLTDPTIIKCLKTQAENGKYVKVICDAKASPYIDSKLGSKVEVTRRFSPGLMHQKILVVDNEKVWIGSANMTSESLRMHGNLVTALNCKNLANLICSKADRMGIEGKGEGFEKETFLIDKQTIEMWFLPDNPKASIYLKNLIRNAKKTIRVAMFTWTRQDFAKEVIAAAQRGIDVEVVIDHHSGKGASAKVVKLLKDHHINVSLSTGSSLLHHKFLYVDNSILVNGSANWTKAAFSQNDDCFIVIHDLTPEQSGQMDSLWQVIAKESQPVP